MLNTAYMDTDWRSDPKIKALEVRLGRMASVIYQDIVFLAKRERDYWIENNELMIITIVSDARCETVTEDFVKSVISECLNVGLFDKGFAENNGILTSKRLAKDYLNVTRRSGRKNIERLYIRTEWEAYGTNPVRESKPTVSNSASSVRENYPNSKAKLSKAKLSKEGQGLCDQQAKRTSHKKFTKPTIEEIESYCTERKNDIDPSAFFDFYESCGWVIGKGSKPMKDWKAAVRQWERNSFSSGRKKQANLTDGRFDKYGT